MRIADVTHGARRRSPLGSGLDGGPTDTHYEPPVLTEIGSFRESTRGGWFADTEWWSPHTGKGV